MLTLQSRWLSGGEKRLRCCSTLRSHYFLRKPRLGRYKRHIIILFHFFLRQKNAFLSQCSSDARKDEAEPRFTKKFPSLRRNIKAKFVLRLICTSCLLILLSFKIAQSLCCLILRSHHFLRKPRLGQ